MRVISPMPCASQSLGARVREARRRATSCVHQTQPSCASFSSSVIRASSASSPPGHSGLTRCGAHAPAALRTVTAADPLGVDGELDLVADDDAAGLERDVPLEAPVLAVDLGLGAEADDGVAPRRALRAEVLALRATTGRVTSRMVRSPYERELAVAVVVDLGRAEGRSSGSARRRRSRPSAGARRASGRRSRRPRRRSSPRPTTGSGPRR